MAFATQAPDHPAEAVVGILAGPTASGKSALSLDLAAKHDLAIVSADSMQVYRGMQIGTGALTEDERRGIPHALLAFADPREEFHAARFVSEASRAIAEQWSLHRRRSLLVGGTGMWIQAFREGLMEAPGRNEALRARYRDLLSTGGEQALWETLKDADPVMAARLSPRDHPRIMRALEVVEQSGIPLSEWMRRDEERRAALGPLLPLVVVTWPRAELYRRIDARVSQMLDAGWKNEAAALLALDLPDHAPARKALGYRELFEVLHGRLDESTALERIRTATRQFARRQLTWYRGQRETTWVEPPNLEKVEAAFGLRTT